MNRGNTFNARRQAGSPSRRDRLQQLDSRGTSRFRNQAAVKQDINIDEFGDMGSDEDDFHSLSSNFVPPKPPAKPQYNLVPYGFLRDDDELVEEDYDGVPIDDSVLQDSPEEEPWHSSPRKSQPEEKRGAPISVLGSSDLLGSQFSHWPTTSSQDSVQRNCPGIGTSSIKSSVNKISVNNRLSGAGRWDKRNPASNSHRWNDKPNPTQGSTPVWAEKGSGSSEKLNAQATTSQSQMFTPTTVTNTSSQIELLQVAALQQALTGLTQLNSQSGLNLLGAQNLLMQATQNPTLAAALVNTGICPIQPNNLNNPSVETLLKSPVKTAPHMAQSSSGLLTYPLRANIIGNSGPRPYKKSIPDGSGATRYPEPDILSLVFDPSTGYRYDSSSGLHYDANSGFFFNSELKVFLRWDKFTQTYLKVDNPPSVPRFNNLSTDFMTYITGSGIIPQDGGKLLSEFSNTAFPKESRQGLAPSIGVPTTSSFAPLMSVPTSRSLASSINAPRTRKDYNSEPSSINTIPSDFSKPPPPLPSSFSQSRFQPTGTNLSSVAEQKAAALPNFAETSLFNKLRKAKLAQTAITKSDRQRWGSPDPLLEAAQKHAAETNNMQDGLLNLKEILQRSRQFMKQKTGNVSDESLDLQMKNELKRSQSGDQKQFCSQSQSVERSSRRSLSSEKPLNRRERKSISPQQQRPFAQDPETRLRRRPMSRGRSPKIRGRRKPSISPARKKRSASRSRSPKNRTRRKKSSSPVAKRRRSASKGQSPTNRGLGSSTDARKRRTISKGRSPSRSTRKSSKSPVPRYRKPIHKGGSPERRSCRRPSISPELKKGIYSSRTPDRCSSPKVKVMLDQSPGGSKIRLHSPGKSNERSADQDLNAQIKKLLRKLNSPSPERARALSPEKKYMKCTVEEKTGLIDRKPVKERLGHANEREYLKKDRVTELKPIPYDTPQCSGKTSSGKGKDGHGYKSLSNLRKQGDQKPREKETDGKQDKLRQSKDKSATDRQPAAIDLTADSEDDDRRGRANHRLVSERKFSSGWVRKKDSPEPKKPDTESESCLLARDTEGKIDEEDAKKLSIEDTKEMEESNDFDFLNDTLDDDKESTVIDEYEEILDYQDLEGTTESLVEESASNHTDTDQVNKKSLNEEPTGSPVIDLCIDPEEHVIEVSMSADSNQESVQCSSVEDNEFVHSLPDNLDKLGEGAFKTKQCVQGNGDTDDLKCLDVEDEDVDGIELHDSEDLEVVSESVGESVKASKPQSGVGIKELDTGEVKIRVKEGSVEPNYVPVRGNTTKGSPKTDEDNNKSNAVEEATSDMKDEPNSSAESKSDSHVPDRLGPGVLENEECNVFDCVDDKEELTKGTVLPSLIRLSGEKQGVMKKHDIESNDPSSTHQNLVSHKSKDDVVKAVQNAAPSKNKDDETIGAFKPQVGDNKLNQQVSKHDAKNKDHDSQFSKDLSQKDETGVQVILGNKRGDAPIQGSNDVDGDKGISSKAGMEEQLSQVRSVSDIEKFLLLSSQQVEAKREQGIEPSACKNDKKSDVFSRLGEKLLADEAGDDPTVVLELPSQTIVPAPDPLRKVSASPAEPPQLPPKAKPTTASEGLASKNANPEDLVNLLFCDQPTPQILIGPMNFIEPLHNFQQFTQRYMTRLLEKEKVKYKKVFVCHEDVTGAPYHYIIIIFHSTKEASDWFKKRKGKFKADQKLFKNVAGHLKHKFIPGAEAFLHFTEGNWCCKVCKKGNFPPRSLCFNCFHHKDPLGFSPLTILDKGPPPYKQSNFVGAPKLKFFVTKEKVIESAPPLDGFDIKNIEMIMDEEMGFPAGICVFELPNHIEAGKLKKYLTRREVEAVSVQMHEKSESLLTGPPIASSRKMPHKVSGSDKHSRPLEEERYVGSGGMQERTLRFPSQEVQPGRSLSPTSSQERRVLRGRSPAPRRGVRVSRGRSPSPVRDVRVSRSRLNSPSRDLRFRRECSTSPVRDSRVSRGRLNSPSRGLRFPRERSPSPVRDVRVVRGCLPSPSRDLRFPRGRSPSPLRQRLSRERVLSRSPSYHSRSRSPRRELYEEKRYPSPRLGEPRRLQSRERASVANRSPVYQSPPRYRSRSPMYDPLSRRSPSPRYRSPSPVRPIKPDGRSDWRYPPPDPTYFRFEPKSGLDYDPATTLYYEPKSCCFYNDDTNEWLEYCPRSGRYTLVR